MDARIELRKKDFKKTFDDPRRRREEQQVQIRKQNREARISAKRQQALAELNSDDSIGVFSPDLQAIPKMAQTLMSTDPHDQLNACQQFRKFLSVEKNPPIQAVIDAQVVPRLVEFLQDDTRPDLQFEAAWALTNIASGTQDQTRVVIDNGAVPVLTRLLMSPIEDVREQAIWALGNIAGDCAALRDMVFDYGALPPILNELTEALKNPVQKASLIRNAAWTLSNLCRAKPKPSLQRILPALPVLRELIHCDDPHVLVDTCWALSYLSDGNDPGADDYIDFVLQAGVPSRLVKLLLHSRDIVQTPALRTVGNIVSGTEQQTQEMINAQCIPALRTLLMSPRKHIRKEASWTISNITAGTESQIQELIQESVIPILISLSTPLTDANVRREVFWALSNAASGASRDQVIYLTQEGIIPPLADGLEQMNDPKLVGSCLEGLNHIFTIGKQLQLEHDSPSNPYVLAFEEAQGLQKLEQLQHQPSDTWIYQFTVKVIKAFFPYEEQEVMDVPQYDFMSGSGLQPSSVQPLHNPAHNTMES